MFEDRIRPQISIVIPSWFTPDQHGRSGELETFWLALESLDRLLETISKDRSRYEIILVDNGSTLEADHVRNSIFQTKKFPSVLNGLDPALASLRFDPDKYWNDADLVIRNKVNLGFAPAMNQGFNLARGEYIVNMNNDVLVWEGWADELVAIMVNKELFPAPGLAMPALLRGVKDPFEAMKIDQIGRDQHYGKIGAHAEFGSMWMARKDVLMKVAGKRDGYQVFDEVYKCGFKEDRQLYRELRELQYETYRTHKTNVYHRGNMTISKVQDRHTYTEENRKIFESRYPTT